MQERAVQKSRALLFRDRLANILWEYYAKVRYF